MKQLTVKQAWLEIARRLEKRGCEYGLCLEAETLFGEGRIGPRTLREMRRAIEAGLAVTPPYNEGDNEDDEGGRIGTWIATPGDAGPRIMAAVLLAEMAVAA